MTASLVRERWASEVHRKPIVTWRRKKNRRSFVGGERRFVGGVEGSSSWIFRSVWVAKRASEGGEEESPDQNAAAYRRAIGRPKREAGKAMRSDSEGMS
jgi:hypothetical protein